MKRFMVLTEEEYQDQFADGYSAGVTYAKSETMNTLAYEDGFLDGKLHGFQLGYKQAKEETR